MPLLLNTLLEPLRRAIDDQEPLISESFTAKGGQTDFVIFKEAKEKPIVTVNDTIIQSDEIFWSSVDPLTIIIPACSEGDKVKITYNQYIYSDDKLKGYLKDALDEMESRWKQGITISDDDNGVPKQVDQTITEKIKRLLVNIVRVLLESEVNERYRDESSTYTKGSLSIPQEERIDRLVMRVQFSKDGWGMGFATSKFKE